MTLSAQDLFKQGRLADAISAAGEVVKGKPTDQDMRGFLAELLCIAGALERADKQMEVLGVQNQELLPGIILLRQIIRAEQSRQQFYAEGRMPEMLAQPDEAIRLSLQASIALRDGEAAEAARLLAQAEEQRAHPSGTCDGESFEDMRDLDDVCAAVFEVLTGNGEYHWIPMTQVVRIEFKPPARARDLLWRRALMTIRDGPDGEVYLPAIYPGLGEDAEEAVRLGQSTEWTSVDGGAVRGVGLRSFLIGDQDKTIMEIEEITFDQPA